MLKIGDYFIIILITLVTGFIFYFAYTAKSSPNNNLIAEVSLDGKTVRTFDIRALKEGEIRNIKLDKLGVRLQAKKDAIRIVDSVCPDKLCVMNSWIESNGEVSICLPQKVILKIVNRDNNSEVDTTSY